MKNTSVYTLFFLLTVSLCNDTLNFRNEESSKTSKCQKLLKTATLRSNVCIKKTSKLYGKVTNNHITLLRNAIADLTQQDCREQFSKLNEECGKIAKKLHALNMAFRSEKSHLNEDNDKKLMDEETEHKVKEETTKVYELNDHCTLRKFEILYF